MIRNYLLIALRVMGRNLSFTLINTLGLSVGLACFILVFIWAKEEWSFDRFHTKADRIYSLGQDQFYNGEAMSFYSMPAPLKQHIDEMVPEVELSVRTDRGTHVLINDEFKFSENILFADPELFQIFDIPILDTQTEEIFRDKFSVVLDKETASKYFSDGNALGKALGINTPNGLKLLTVSAILGDMPRNSKVYSRVIVPFELLSEMGRDLENWGNSYHIDVLVSENTNQVSLDRAIDTLLFQPQQGDSRLFSHKLADRHLYRLHYKDGGLIDYVYILGTVALFVLFIACVNFMNLTTARSIQRAKEIGIRKTVGGNRIQIVLQFFGESILISLLSLNIAFVLAELLLPAFNMLLPRQLTIPYTDLFFMSLMFGTGLLTGILSGIYPAFVMSSFSAVQILKSKSVNVSGAWLRQTLVVIQFVISGVLLTCTFIISDQMEHIRTLDLGIDRENMMYFDGFGLSKGEILQRNLKNIPGVVSVSTATHLPTAIFSNGGGWEWTGKDKQTDVLITFFGIDPDYLKTLGTDLVQGRNFDFSIASDSINNVIINESFAKMISSENILQEQISQGDQKFNIIGVVENFNYRPVLDDVGPMILYLSRNNPFYFIRYEAENVSTIVSAIEDENRKLNPDLPIQVGFLSEMIDGQYSTQKRTSSLITYFGVVALIISCLGLYGLSMFVAERRLKEMAIRKIMGASDRILLTMMGKTFLLLVLIASLIAVFISDYLMDSWLTQFYYRIDPGVLHYGPAMLISLIIALFTVLYQSLKVANTNPVETLRQE